MDERVQGSNLTKIKFYNSFYECGLNMICMTMINKKYTNCCYKWRSFKKENINFLTKSCVNQLEKYDFEKNVFKVLNTFFSKSYLKL